MTKLAVKKESEQMRMAKREPTAAKVTDRFGTAVSWLNLKAPVEFFERLDHWREQQDFTPKPSRPAAIRWIVHQFLLKQEAREERKGKTRAVKPARGRASASQRSASP